MDRLHLQEKYFIYKRQYSIQNNHLLNYDIISGTINPKQYVKNKNKKNNTNLPTAQHELQKNIKSIKNSKNKQQLKMQTTNMQIPTHENISIGTLELYEQYEKHITARQQARHQLQIQSMLVDHDNQKFNLQTEKLELIYQNSQLEKKCQLLQSRVDLNIIMKNQYQMKSKYMKEEIDALQKSIQVVKNINVKLDEKICKMQQEHQKDIQELNKACEKSVQDMSNKLKIVKEQLKTTTEEQEEKINSLQNDKKELSEQVNLLRQSLDQSNTMYDKLKKFIMASCGRLTSQEQVINQFDILNRAEEYIAKSWAERDSIVKVIQNYQKGKQMKDAPLAQKISSIIQIANRQRTKIETSWNQFEAKLNNLLKLFIKDYAEQHGHQLLEVLETKIVEYESEISEKSSLLSNLTKQAKQIAKQLKKIPEYEKQIKQLKQELANKQIKLSEQKQRNMKAVSNIEIEQKSTINNANKQRQKLQQRIEQLQRLINARDQQISEQMKEKGIKKEQVRLQKQAHRQKQAKLTESIQKIASLEQDIKKLVTDNKALQQRIRNQKQTNQKYISQRKQSQDKMSRILKQLSQAKNEIQVLRNKVQEANKKQNNSFQLQRDKADRQNNINNLNKQLKQLRNRNEELDQLVNKLNKNIKTKQQDIKQKQSRIQFGFQLEKQVCHLAGTYCTNNTNYKITSCAEAIKMLEAKLAVNKINKSQNDRNPFLTIPTLSRELGDDLDWVKPFICKDYQDKKITSHYLKTQRTEIDFTQYVGRTNIMMLIMTENNAVFMLMMRRVIKSEEKKTGNDTMFIVTKDKKRYPPSGSQGGVFPCVNKAGVLVLGKDNDILITKKLKVQIDFKEGGYFGEVDVQSMLNFTDAQKKEFKINQVQIYEILQK